MLLITLFGMGFEKKRKKAIPSATYTTYQAGQSNPIQTILKLSRNKKDLNDVTAALFLVSFSKQPAAKNTHAKNRAAKGQIMSECIL